MAPYALSRAALLSVGLVALAVANASFMDSMGAYLTDQVYAKHEALGSGWLLIQNPLADPRSPFLVLADDVAASIGQAPSVEEALAYRQATHVQVGDDATNLDLVLLGPTYDLARHPYIFVLYGSETLGTLFLKNDLTLRAGRFPQAPGEVALERGFAEREGISPGARVALRHDPFSHGAPPLLTVHVTGTFDRAKRGDLSELTPIVLAAHDETLEHALTTGGLAHSFPSAVVMARMGLREIGAGLVDVRGRIEGHGFHVRLAVPDWLGIPPTTAGPGLSVQQENAGAPPPEVIVYANGNLLADALAAAGRTAGWYRLLGVSAALIASLGVAFVTASAARRMRREAALRQALGFPAWRLWARALKETALVGAAGGLAGALLAAALVASGLASSMLGVAFALDLPMTFAGGIAFGGILHAAAALPVHALVLRASPAENLRMSKE